MRMPLFAFVLWSLLPACEDGESCTHDLRPGLEVRVTETGGADVCDAMVTAREGTYVETLKPGLSGASCVYFGAYERGGTYELTASKGASTTTVSATVSEDECHVERELMTIVLPL